MSGTAARPREFLDDADVALKSYRKTCCAQNTSGYHRQPSDPPNTYEA